MAEMNQGMFRAAALERLASPERLDTVVKIVSPRSWIPLAAGAVMVVAALAWGIFGRLPITVTARGVLLRPSTIRPVQAPGDGLLASFSARVGDVVKKGQTIGAIDQYQLRQRLDQAKAKRRVLEAHRTAAAALEKKSAELELGTIARQREYTQKRMEELREDVERQKKLDEAVLAQTRAGLVERLEATNRILAEAKKRVAAFVELRKGGHARDEEVLEAERSANDVETRILDIKKEQQAANLTEAENERQRHERLDKVASLEDQLADLELKGARIRRQELESQAVYERDRRELDDSIASLELSSAREGLITAGCDGRILELSAAIGQQVQQGMRLALIEEGDPTRGLVCVAFVAVKDGKRTPVGGAVQVEPDTVPRDRFGGMLGEVRAVSSFPVSAEAAQSLIGNADIAKEVLGEGAKILVTIDLEPNPATPSGHAWSSSRGPDMKVSAGTTGTVRLRLEERAPITFVLPSLRGILGL